MKLDNVYIEYNEQLFSWVIENLYKNSIDAVSEDGEININLVDKKNSVIIDFIDDGKGIEKGEFKKIFSPGYTSKRRGWGLGLTLAKRIIENYHKGKIYVLKSTKNIETIIRIELNK
jgi:signal transduction histidine kinase